MDREQIPIQVDTTEVCPGSPGVESDSSHGSYPEGVCGVERVN
jgi:hypothetical protein